jgi:cytochrome c2
MNFIGDVEKMKKKGKVTIGAMSIAVLLAGMAILSAVSAYEHDIDEEKSYEVDKLSRDLEDAVTSYNDAVTEGNLEDAWGYVEKIDKNITELEALGMEIEFMTTHENQGMPTTVSVSVNPITEQNRPRGHSISANEEQLEIMNQLVGQDITMGEFYKKVFPEVLEDMPEEISEHLYATKMILPEPPEMTKVPNETEDGKATDEEVAWIRDQIEKWEENPEMEIGATAILRTEKTVVLWVYERTPENMQLYRKRINGWEIIVVESAMPTDAMPTDEEIAWIKDQIEKWKENPEMRVDATAILRAEKTVVLWVYERTPENQQLHRKMINGWGIIVVEIWPTDEEIAWIKDQIEKWKENPEMEIGGTSIDCSAWKTVTLWVDEHTQENQRLHHEMIGGWEIIVAESPKPPLTIGIVALSIGVVAVIAFVLLLIYKKFRKSYRESRKEK